MLISQQERKCLLTALDYDWGLEPYICRYLQWITVQGLELCICRCRHWIIFKGMEPFIYRWSALDYSLGAGDGAVHLQIICFRWTEHSWLYKSTSQSPLLRTKMQGTPPHGGHHKHFPVMNAQGIPKSQIPDRTMPRCPQTLTFRLTPVKFKATHWYSCLSMIQNQGDVREPPNQTDSGESWSGSPL